MRYIHKKDLSTTYHNTSGSPLQFIALTSLIFHVACVLKECIIFFICTRLKIGGKTN